MWGYMQSIGMGMARKGCHFGGFGRGMGICKWYYFQNNPNVPFYKEALKIEKNMLEQRLKLIEQLLNNDNLQDK